MISMVKAFLFDDTAGRRGIRALSFGLAALVATGDVELPGWVAGLAAVMGGMIGAGEKNPRPTK